MSIMHNPLHPGKIVRDALFNETDLQTVEEAAKKLKVERTTLSRLLNGHSGISPEMAYKLSLLLEPSCEMWMNLQRDYDLWKVRKKYKKLHIEKIHSRRTKVQETLESNMR